MTPKKITSKMKLAKAEDLVARALRQYAAQLLHRQSLGFVVPVEEARALDRALRSCEGISDIDLVWFDWRYVGKTLGWITTDEMHYDWRKGWYRYVVSK